MDHQLDALVKQGVFHFLYQNYPDGICIVNSDDRFLDANLSALRITGYSLEELRQSSVGAVFDSNGYQHNVSGTNANECIGMLVRHRLGHRICVNVSSIGIDIGEQATGRFLILKDANDTVKQRDQRNGPLNVQEMFTFISEKSQNIISSFSPDHVFTYISPTVQTLLGYTPEEVIGRSAFEFNHPDDNIELTQFPPVTSSDPNTARFVGRVRHKNGAYRWYETTTQYIRDETGRLVQTIGVGRDITERKRAEETIAHMAYHDALTELPNRRLFFQRIGSVLEATLRDEAVHGLMLLDLDGFKYVNDTYGHSVGDALLMEVANRLTSTAITGTMVARLGGDEFVIFQTNVKSLRDWSWQIGKIKDVIAKPITLEDKTLYVTASIGVALYPTDGTSVESLMGTADAAMYRAKNASGE